MTLDEALDELYLAAPADFVEARARLKKQLDKKEAAVLNAVRKPPVTVWLVNHLYVSDRKRFDRLLALGSELKTAQKKGGPAMAALRREQADLVADLRSAAIDQLRTIGQAATGAITKRVETNLRTLSAVGSFEPDPQGRLTRDREEVGFAVAFGTPIAAPAPVDRTAEKAAEKAKAKEERDRQRKMAAVQARLEQLERDRDEVAAQLAELERKIDAQRRLLAS